MAFERARLELISNANHHRKLIEDVIGVKIILLALDTSNFWQLVQIAQYIDIIINNTNNIPQSIDLDF